MRIRRPRTLWNWLAASLVAALLAGGSMSAWWLGRHAIAARGDIGNRPE